MHVVRSDEAVAYRPPGHHHVAARRLQGAEAGGPDGLTVGISHYPPGATVDPAATAGDTVYVVLAGRLTLTSHDDGRTLALGRHDSVHLPVGEVRSLRNEGDDDAVLLVVMRPPSEGSAG
ncbi:cupin domain-containing protein [Actinomadura fibrosa]|uniref:Cupin domain-containing protein n=1 Tax=Actinomadura fibrosa TaxID=111802 RepID=A0ABW2XV09_9ACTN|nr:cupin domain-containing protein [Actinomadura fibrosa]